MARTAARMCQKCFVEQHFKHLLCFDNIIIYSLIIFYVLLLTYLTAYDVAIATNFNWISENHASVSKFKF